MNIVYKMDNFLYTYFGYNEEYIKNKNVLIIQRAYRNFKNYKKYKIADYIKYFNIFNNKSDEILNKEDNEEVDYWDTQRYLIKNKIIGNYVIIN
tara:strand:- start:3 stop:284 length:282 start_codon:yes stop_codon:yes gene_type:complete